MSKPLRPADRIVGDRCRQRRVMLERNQSELAAAMGMSFPQIGKYERGKNQIGASSLQKIGQE